MSARNDALRVTALITAVEALAKGKPQQLGDLAAEVFGWTHERVSLAIDAALQRGFIQKNVSGRVSS